jgi:hypothetical protein
MNLMRFEFEVATELAAAVSFLPRVLRSEVPETLRLSFPLEHPSRICFQTKEELINQEASERKATFQTEQMVARSARTMSGHPRSQRPFYTR